MAGDDDNHTPSGRHRGADYWMRGVLDALRNDIDFANGRIDSISEHEIPGIKVDIATLIAFKDGFDKDKYVNKDQFQPVARLVYGVTALMLTGVITAIMALVLRSGGGLLK
jgi:hypothetical protein